jgi:hypothetical protein
MRKWVDVLLCSTPSTWNIIRQHPVVSAGGEYRRFCIRWAARQPPRVHSSTFVRGIEIRPCEKHLIGLLGKMRGGSPTPSIWNIIRQHPVGSAGGGVQAVLLGARWAPYQVLAVLLAYYYVGA